MLMDLPKNGMMMEKELLNTHKIKFMNYKELMKNAYYPLMDKEEEGIIELTTAIVGYRFTDPSLIDSPNNPIPYESINNFYRNFGSCSITWKGVKEYWEKIGEDMPDYFEGEVNIDAFKVLLDSPYIKDGKAFYDSVETITIHGEEMPIPPNLTFYDLGYCTEGCAVGFFVGEGYDDAIWYRNVEDSFMSLGVNIDGYMQLLAKNYGMRHWQTDSDDLEHTVPFIDENFTLKAYEELEESLYLYKK